MLHYIGQESEKYEKNIRNNCHGCFAFTLENSKSNHEPIQLLRDKTILALLFFQQIFSKEINKCEFDIRPLIGKYVEKKVGKHNKFASNFDHVIQYMTEIVGNVSETLAQNITAQSSQMLNGSPLFGDNFFLGLTEHIRQLAEYLKDYAPKISIEQSEKNKTDPTTPKAETIKKVPYSYAAFGLTGVAALGFVGGKCSSTCHEIKEKLKTSPKARAAVAMTSIGLLIVGARLIPPFYSSKKS